MDLDSTLCHCHHITKRKIVNFVRQTHPRRASQISECFEAGSGCGWCIPFLVKIHRELVGGESSTDDSLEGEDYEAQRARYLQDLKSGKTTRNRYEPTGKGPTPSDRASPGQKTQVEEEPEEFDYTRYFSRSRPDPEPETLE